MSQRAPCGDSAQCQVPGGLRGPLPLSNAEVPQDCGKISLRAKVGAGKRLDGTAKGRGASRDSSTDQIYI